MAYSTCHLLFCEKVQFPTTEALEGTVKDEEGAFALGVTMVLADGAICAMKTHCYLIGPRLSSDGGSWHGLVLAEMAHQPARTSIAGFSGPFWLLFP